MKGISGRQGRLTAPHLRSSILDCRFPGVHISVHPDPNPLCFQISLRLGFDSLFAPCKTPHEGASLHGAGEGNRTLDVSLGSSSFAIKLHLRITALYVPLIQYTSKVASCQLIFQGSVSAALITMPIRILCKLHGSLFQSRLLLHRRSH